jgi:hypothetical protein
MWLLRYLIFYIVLSVFGLTLILFLGQNLHTERLVFFGLEYTTNMVWVLVGAAAFGALVVLALLLPGRLAVTMHVWSVEREVQHVEQDLGHLQEQRERLLARHEHLLEAYERLLQGYQRLVAEHSRTVAERDRVRSQLAAGDAGDVTRAPQIPAPPPALPAPAATRKHITVPGLAIVSPVSSVTADVGSQPNGARGERVPPTHGIAPSSGSAAGTAAGQGRNIPAEAARAADRLAPAESAEHQPAIVEQAPILPGAGHTEVEPASVWSPTPAASPPPPTAEPLELAGPMPPPPAQLVTAASASANSPATGPTASANAPSARPLAELRDRLYDRLREDIANSAALIAALWDTVAAQLARLRRLSLLDRLPSGPTSDTPGDLPENNDPG